MLERLEKETQWVSKFEKYLEPDVRHRVDRTNFRSFRGKEHLDNAESLINCMLASAAIPVIMRGPVVDGSVNWDGLFSQNPPIYELPDIHGAGYNNDPRQIWVIRINPMEVADVPKSAKEIADRRNELSGNLSLLQEIRAVHKMNGVLKVRESKGRKEVRVYHPIGFGFIDMAESVAAPLDYSSKLDRRIESLWPLYKHGIEQAHAFYQRWDYWYRHRGKDQPVEPADSGEIQPELLIGAVDVQHAHRYHGDVVRL
jgi:hypothetical protein